VSAGLPEPLEEPLPAKRSALDRAMDDLAGIPPRVWTVAWWQTAVGTVAVLALTVLVLLVWREATGRTIDRTAAYTIGLLGESSLLLIALFAARKVRAFAGGWGPALGWGRPGWRDLWWGLLWAVVQLTISVLIRTVYDSVASASTVHSSINTRNVTYHGPVWLILALVAGTVIAPVAEETQCRGVLLRAGMSRWTFSRSALVSSAFFGLLHADQAGSVGGAVLLVLAIGTFGFFQCVLVRITGRLAPGAIAHGLTNTLALVGALSR
jgi:membrane protease YdiL (CAAX protease family)